MIRILDFDRDLGDLRSFLSEKDTGRLDLCRRAIADGDAFAFVAVEGDRGVGWGIVHTRYRDDLGWHPDGRTPSFIEGENAYLENMEIEEGRRGRGLGGELLAALEAEAARLGKRKLWLHTGERNTGAHRFYERHGWTHKETVAVPWHPEVPSRVYSKRIP